MRFSGTKLLRRCLLSSALLTSGAMTSAADQDGNTGWLQGLITGRKATATRTQPATQSTTVQVELEKLFKTGQVQTSQHQTGASTPTVKLIQHQSEEESSGLFRQIFSGTTATERRAKRLESRANRGNPQASNHAPSVPKPPPIDFANQQPSQQKSSVNAHLMGLATQVTEPPGVPPAEVKTAESFTLKPAAVDKFVSPFIDDELLERKSFALDLNSLVDRPADRSEAMPITTEGDAVDRLVELVVPLKAPATDPLLSANTLVLPTVDAAQHDTMSAKPVSTQTVIQERVVEEVMEEIVMQSQVAPTKVIESSELPQTESMSTEISQAAEPIDDQGKQIEVDQAKTAEKAERQYEERNARRQQQRYLITSRPGRTGFKGFCPVSLRENRMLRDSSTTHAARFGLKTYYFASDDDRRRFESDPARYAPAAGGSDVVLLANTGEETEGSLDFCLWYRDRLYMFRSRETQAIFSTDPARFANQY